MRLTGLFVLALAFAGSSTAQQSSYPNRPIRIVVSSATGGLIDTVTRLVAQKMSEDLGQSVVIENQGGGGTVLATRAIKAAPPDGYTLLATSNSILSAWALRTNPGYDLFKDFVPIGTMIQSPWFLVVGGTQPDNNLRDLVARGKANPGKLTFASSGVGGSPHLATEQFLKRAGISAVHAPYKGNGAAMPDVIAGRVTMIFEGIATAMPKVRAGQFKVMGVSSTKRLDAFPDIPTMAEQGLPGFSTQVFAGLFAPARTPPEIVERISVAMKRATASKELQARFHGDGMDIGTYTPQQFREALAVELAETVRLVETLGLPRE